MIILKMDSKERTLKGIQSKVVHENGCHLWKGTLVKNIRMFKNYYGPFLILNER